MTFFGEAFACPCCGLPTFELLGGHCTRCWPESGLDLEERYVFLLNLARSERAIGCSWDPERGALVLMFPA